jgi:poly(3-hydroxybutyrate) depolymerase
LSDHSKTGRRNHVGEKGNTHSWRGFPATAGLCAWAFSLSLSAAPALEEVAAGVKLDPAQISVSGISSGGFMAHQFHVAHSQHIMGAGIVAGGPYYCARGNIVDALTRCSRFATLECLASKLDPKLCGKTDLAPKNRSEIERAAAASFAEARKQETPARSVRSPICATTRSICSAAATTRSSRTR